MLEGRCLPRACRRDCSFPRLRYGQARAPLGFGEGLPEHHLVACGRPSTLAGYPLPSGVRAADLWVGVLYFPDEPVLLEAPPGWITQISTILAASPLPVIAARIGSPSFTSDIEALFPFIITLQSSLS